MTIPLGLESIAKWMGDNVCPKVTLKIPSDKNVEHFETGHPASFAMFLPTKEKLPPGVKAECPAVVTQLIEGSHLLTEGKARYKLQFSFTAWNPGTHPQETSGADKMERDTEGWKDVWNFVERALQELENAEYLADNFRIAKELGITFGQFQLEEQISDLYPYWGAWVILTVEQGLQRTAGSYKNLL